MQDLTSAGETIIGQTWRVFEIWIFIAVLCLIWDVVYQQMRIRGIEVSAQDLCVRQLQTYGRQNVTEYRSSFNGFKIFDGSVQ